MLAYIVYIKIYLTFLKSCFSDKYEGKEGEGWHMGLSFRIDVWLEFELRIFLAILNCKEQNTKLEVVCFCLGVWKMKFKQERVKENTLTLYDSILMHFKWIFSNQFIGNTKWKKGGILIWQKNTLKNRIINKMYSQISFKIHESSFFAFNY